MREWTGSVFRAKGEKSWTAKWLCYQKGTHQKTRFPTKAMASDFLKDKRDEHRRRARGDWNEAEEYARSPITEHVTAFESYLLARVRRRGDDRDEKNAKLVAARLTHAFEQMRVQRLANLKLDACARFLTGLLDGTTSKPTGKGTRRPCSASTRNDYAQALRQFSKWAHRTERLQKHLLDEDTLPDIEASDRKRRPALTAEQVAVLVAAGPQRVLQRGPKATRSQQLETAHRRALTVALAFYTGLRNGELARMTWGWLDLDARVLTVPATASKSGQQELLPLHDSATELLLVVRRQRAVDRGQPVPNSDLVLGTMVNGTPKLPKNLPERLRADAAFAELPVADATGGLLDLHAVRTSFANALDELGLPEGVVGELMRHKPQRVLGQHYLRRRIERLRRDLNDLPGDAARAALALLADQAGPRNGPRKVRTDEAGSAGLPPPPRTATS